MESDSLVRRAVTQVHPDEGRTETQLVSSGAIETRATRAGSPLPSVVASAAEDFNPSRAAAIALAVDRVLSKDASNHQGTIGRETGRAKEESRQGERSQASARRPICMIDTAGTTWP